MLNVTNHFRDFRCSIGVDLLTTSDAAYGTPAKLARQSIISNMLTTSAASYKTLTTMSSLTIDRTGRSQRGFRLPALTPLKSPQQSCCRLEVPLYIRREAEPDTTDNSLLIEQCSRQSHHQSVECKQHWICSDINRHPCLLISRFSLRRGSKLSNQSKLIVNNVFTFCNRLYVRNARQIPAQITGVGETTV